MPIYEYVCKQHGPFEDLVPLSRCSMPSACPDCGETSKRVISAPAIYSLDRSVVIAKDRNERSQHEPRLRCKQRPKREVGAPRVTKAYRGPRPWVIEHS